MTNFETQTGLVGELTGMRAIFAIPDFLTVEQLRGLIEELVSGRSVA